MDRILILFKPSSAQQGLISTAWLGPIDRNPSSPLFHRWLTPEESRKIASASSVRRSMPGLLAWLAAEGPSTVK